MINARNILPNVYLPVLVRLDHDEWNNRYCVAYLDDKHRWHEVITELDLLENGYHVVEWQTIRESINFN